MSAAKMVADSTSSLLDPKAGGKRKKKTAHKKKKTKKQKLTNKKSKKDAENEEDDSDLDLSKHLMPMDCYLKDRGDMLEQMFTCLAKGQSLQRYIPDVLKELPLHNLKQRCLEQLEIMSKKRIKRILAGDDPATISSSGTEDESTDEEMEHSRGPKAQKEEEQEVTRTEGEEESSEWEEIEVETEVEVEVEVTDDEEEHEEGEINTADDDDDDEEEEVVEEEEEDMYEEEEVEGLEEVTEEDKEDVEREIEEGEVGDTDEEDHGGQTIEKEDCQEADSTTTSNQDGEFSINEMASPGREEIANEDIEVDSNSEEEIEEVEVTEEEVEVEVEVTSEADDNTENKESKKDGDVKEVCEEEMEAIEVIREVEDNLDNHRTDNDSVKISSTKTDSNKNITSDVENGIAAPVKMDSSSKNDGIERTSSDEKVSEYTGEGRQTVELASDDRKFGDNSENDQHENDDHSHISSVADSIHDNTSSADDGQVCTKGSNSDMSSKDGQPDWTGTKKKLVLTADTVKSTDKQPVTKTQRVIVRTQEPISVTSASKSEIGIKTKLKKTHIEESSSIVQLKTKQTSVQKSEFQKFSSAVPKEGDLGQKSKVEGAKSNKDTLNTGVIPQLKTSESKSSDETTKVISKVLKSGISKTEVSVQKSDNDIHKAQKVGRTSTSQGQTSKVEIPKSKAIISTMPTVGPAKPAEPNRVKADGSKVKENERKKEGNSEKESHKDVAQDMSIAPMLTQNQMELLELEMRARAIKAMLKAQELKDKTK